MILNLDNEVYFKKAFTNKTVFRCFVRDVTGVDAEFGKIETEKRFSPKFGYVNFKYDIFAETLDHRVIVEIQKIDYDYNFDRFLLYHNMALAELQRSSREYKIEKTVYTIVVVTEPYRMKDRKGALIKHDILIHRSNFFTFSGEEVDIFEHKLFCLNPNYINDKTPSSIKDWLHLVNESIKNPYNFEVNQSNEGIKEVLREIDDDNISVEDRTLAKQTEAAKSKAQLILEEGILLGEQKGERKKSLETAAKMKQKGFSLEMISECTGLSVEEINKI